MNKPKPLTEKSKEAKTVCSECGQLIKKILQQCPLYLGHCYNKKTPKEQREAQERAVYEELKKKYDQ